MRDALSEPGVQAVLYAMPGAGMVLAGLVNLALAEGRLLWTVLAVAVLGFGLVRIVGGVRTYRRLDLSRPERDDAH